MATQHGRQEDRGHPQAAPVARTRALAARDRLRDADRGDRHGLLPRPAGAGLLDVGQPLAAARDADVQRPGQLHQDPRQPAVRGRDLVHAEVHGDHHRRAVGGRDGARPDGAGPPPRRGAVPDRVLPPGRDRLRGRRAALLRLLQRERPAGHAAAEPRDRRRAGRLARHPERRAVLDDRDGRLALRRLQHADPADRAAEHPDRDLRGGARATAPRAGRPSATSRCRCCGPRSR